MGVVSLSRKPSAPSIWQPGTRCAQIWMICVPPSAPPAQLAVAPSRRSGAGSRPCRLSLASRSVADLAGRQLQGGAGGGFMPCAVPAGTWTVSL